MTVSGVLIVYALFGCIYWLWMIVGAVRIVRAVPLIENLRPPDPAVWPSLSVIIPVCNEAEAIEAAATTVLEQQYPDLEVVLIDDRSTDETGAIIDRLAASDPRVVAMHVTHLPEGWLGKVHALDRGAARASGQWLLFADADVHMSPILMQRTIAYCEHRKLDHLALIPDIWRSSPWLAPIMALFFRVFTVGKRCWAIEDNESGASIGIGAFNLVRRTALEQTAGFDWLRLEVTDDVGLGMMLKRSGAHSCLGHGRGMLGLHWYRTVPEMAQGMEKAYASVGNCSVRVVAFICFVLTAMECAPFVMVMPWRLPGLWWSGLFMIGAAVASSVVFARWVKRSIWPGLFFPLAAMLCSVLLLRAAWLGFRRGGVAWRGTLYPSAELRAGRRIDWN